MNTSEPLGQDAHLQLLKNMKRIREFELHLQKLYVNKTIRGTLHICVGQEAVAVGVGACLDKGDFVTSTHRGHGHLLAVGGQMGPIMAELLGRKSGYCQGKGGTQHLASLECGFLGSNGITGGGLPYATGMALAMNLRELKNVVVCFFGDGASNQGTFHESLNMAAIWKLPILFLLENNGYAMSSPVRQMAATPTLAIRASAYGITGYQVDGNDVIAVRNQVASALSLVRAGEGPVLVEALTYRMSGHSCSDRCHYRTREEERAWAARCPITKLQDSLLSQGIEPSVFADMDQNIGNEIAAAFEFASASGTLTKHELLEGVYS